MLRECTQDRRSTPRRLSIVLGIIVGLLGLHGAVHAQTQEAEHSPDAVKAAFLFHFGAFVEWPPGALPPDEFTISVLGAPGVFNELHRVAPERNVRGRKLRVRLIDSAEDIGSSHIVFIAASHGRQLPDVARAARARPILLVTNHEDGLRKGAAINFVVREQRVRFEVSVPAAQGTGLQLSSRLLSAALHVERTGNLMDPWGSQYAGRHCFWITDGERCHTATANVMLALPLSPLCAGNGKRLSIT
jgi:hypothetical protein